MPPPFKRKGGVTRIGLRVLLTVPLALLILAAVVVHQGRLQRDRGLLRLPSQPDDPPSPAAPAQDDDTVRETYP